MAVVEELLHSSGAPSSTTCTFKEVVSGRKIGPHVAVEEAREAQTEGAWGKRRHAMQASACNFWTQVGEEANVHEASAISSWSRTCLQC